MKALLAAPAVPSLFAAIRRRLFAPTDLAALACFRFAFGLLMAWDVARYWSGGWVTRYWIEPAFHFTYWGFGWVRPWPGIGMHVHAGALVALAALVALGLRYRLSAALFFLGFTYLFLLDQARYLNHFYLICLVALLMVLVPAHRLWSLDARLRPALRADAAPAWTLWLLRVQVGIPYFYGGIAKINGDWLRAEPMRSWLAESQDFPVIGRYFTEEWAAYLFSYGGLAFDLLVVPALLWPRTRPLAYAAAVLFHVTNAILFNIGVFPWLMIAATTIFFDPSWPRRLFGLARVRAWPRGGAVNDLAPAEPAAPRPRRPGLVLALLGVYVAVQVLVPLRHFLYPGNVSWTEEGHNFAWHMKLRGKQGEARFFVTEPRSGQTWEVNVPALLHPWQIGKMAGEPDMIIQLAHHVAEQMRRRGFERVEVRARVMASLNGRQPQPLVDPDVDLAAERRSPWPARWIVPLREALPPPWRTPVPRG